MTIQELFDQLVLERKLKLQLDKSQADSVRVQLAKKWKKYKTDLDSCGFLAADLAKCSIRRIPPTKEENCWTFLLEERTKVFIEYAVLEN